MPTKKFSIKGKNAKQLANETAPVIGYHGPTPPKDVYKVVVKQLKLKGPNRNGDDMINGVAEIAEPDKSPKSKYNGYGVWFNLNISDQGAPYINQFIGALMGPNGPMGFWEKGVQTEGKEEYGKIIRMAGKPVQDGTLSGIIGTKDGTDNNDGRKLEVAAWLLKDASDDDDDVESEDAEDASDDDVEVEFDEGDDDETADDEPADDEETEESEDDEEDSEDEDDEDDGSAERLEELKGMTRAELVKIAKEKGIKAVKSKSEEDYIKEIMESEFDEPPF